MRCSEASDALGGAPSAFDVITIRVSGYYHPPLSEYPTVQVPLSEDHGATKYFVFAMHDRM